MFAMICSFPLEGEARVRPVANPRYASLIIDGDTGNVLHAENANAKRYPASLTKMMTLYLAFEALRSGKLSMDTMMPVSRHAASMPQTNLFLRPGDRISVRDAIKALIIRSANDVAVVMAEAIGNSEWEFANQMTQKARQLGMNATVFRNANGLPDNRQYTTARDMAVLAMALKKHFPQYYPLFKTTQFTYRGRTYLTHNHVMERLPGAEGLKTGYINASGFNLVTSAVRGGRNLVGVVMGGRTAYTRDSHMIKLMEQSFTHLARGTGAPQYVAEANPQKSSFARIPRPVAKPRIQLASNDASWAVGVQQQPSPPPALVMEPPAAPRGQFMQVAEKEWAIQVGAYSGMPEAMMAATNAVRMAVNELADAKIAVSNGKDQTNGQEIHRARLANLDETQAHHACQRLIALRQSCFVIKLDRGESL